MSGFFATHRGLLDRALAAGLEVGRPPVLGDVDDVDDGAAAYADLLRRPFELPGALGAGRLGDERSSYGPSLGITYPVARPDEWLAAAEATARPWAAVPIEQRVGVALEALVRLHGDRAVLAQAAMHTGGRSLDRARASEVGMALERALAAVALAYAAMRQVPAGSPAADRGRPRLRIVPRGPALVIAPPCQALVHALPALMVNLAAGNPVLVKPDPAAILPVALSIRTVRAVLAEASLEPAAVQLCVDAPAAPIAPRLALQPSIQNIDFAGSPAFAGWLRREASHAQLHLSPTTMSPVVIDAADDLGGFADHLATALLRDSGQSCTSPRLLFVPETGIATAAGHRSFEAVGVAIAAAIDARLEDRCAGLRLCGAIPAQATLDRLHDCRRFGRIVRDTAPLDPADFPRARTASPLLVAVPAAAEQVYDRVRFGPIAFLVATADTAESIERAAHLVRRRGATTAAVHATDDHVLEAAVDELVASGAGVACNVRDGGAETPSVLDPGLVVGRFRIAGVRRGDRLS